MKRSNVGYELIQQNLAEIDGVVVRQQTQAAAKKVKHEPNDPKGWTPTGPELKALEPFMRAQEESGFWTRMFLTFIGCGNLRPLKMHFTVAGETGDVNVIDRPFKCGGGLCRLFGRCFSACCLATTYTDIERALPDGSYEKRYSLRVNLACCGRVNNCCAPSCCKTDAVYDILDPEGAIVANLQVSYGSDDCLKALFRAAGDFTNYVLQFPRDFTPQDRALLLAALFQLDYAEFEGQHASEE